MWLSWVVSFEMRAWEIRGFGVESEIHDIPFLGLGPRKGLAGELSRLIAAESPRTRSVLWVTNRRPELSRGAAVLCST
jgi:hypothetical protein